MSEISSGYSCSEIFDDVYSFCVLGINTNLERCGQQIELELSTSCKFSNIVLLSKFLVRPVRDLN